MSQNTIYVNTTSPAIELAVYGLPTTIHRGSAAVNAMMKNIGIAVLTRIKQAFIVKSTGGTDEAGDRWAPLSPKTMSTRIRKRGKVSITISRTSTQKHEIAKAARAELWHHEYRRGLAMFKGNKQHAARRAWMKVNANKTSTPFNKYSTRVDILRDTGLLLRSLSPDTSSSERILAVSSGSVTIGTKVKYAAAHHKGVPGRLPQRRLWPPTNKWPPSWWKDILAAAQKEVVNMTIKLVQEVRT